MPNTKNFFNYIVMLQQIKGKGFIHLFIAKLFKFTFFTHIGIFDILHFFFIYTIFI